MAKVEPAAVAGRKEHVTENSAVHDVEDRLAARGHLGVIRRQSCPLHAFLHSRHRGCTEVILGLGEIGERGCGRELGHGDDQGRRLERIHETHVIVTEPSLGRQIGVVGTGGHKGENRTHFEIAFGGDLGHDTAPPFGHRPSRRPSFVIRDIVAGEVDRKGHDLSRLGIENVD